MKARIAVALLLIAGTASAEEKLTEFKFDAPRPAAASDAPLTCAYPNFKAPETMVVYAAGAYSGRKVPFQIDQNGHHHLPIPADRLR